MDGIGPAFGTRQAFGPGTRHQQRHGDGRGDIHLGPHGTHFGDQPHHPIQFRPRFRCIGNLHGFGPGATDQATLSAIAHAVPQLLSNEGHDRMQHAENHAQHMRGGGFHLILVGTIRAIQHGLGEFQEPIAEIIPGKAIAGLGIIIEAEAFQSGIRLS